MNAQEFNDYLNGLDREELCTVLNNCIEAIWAHNLFMNSAKTKRRTQAELADHIDGKPRTFAAAKNPGNGVSVLMYVKYITGLCKAFELIVHEDFQVKPVIDNSDPLNELARKLAMNLVDISTRSREERVDYENIFTDPGVYKNRSQGDKVRDRFIAVVGGGFSHAATYDTKAPIPDSVEMIQRLRDAYEGNVIVEWVEDEINRLKSMASVQDADFETSLIAFTRFNEAFAVSELRKMCGYKHVPNLSCEILAHLLKHRFLDVILNFNFDELLDNAIEEEIPVPGDYLHVFSEGHCPSSLDELKIDDRIKKPIYIKCQGTISQPNSLRFNGDKAFTIERGIQRLIADLLSGKPGKWSVPVRVNVLVFGFGMNNQSFNNLLENTPKGEFVEGQELVFWLFDADAKLKDKILNRFHTHCDRLRVISIPNVIKGRMEGILVHLWAKLYSKFKTRYKPEDIARHQLVNLIFKTQGYDDQLAINTYHKHRLYVELAILTLQSKGIVHLSQITQSRAGKYYALIRQNRTTELDAIYDVLRKIGIKKFGGFMYDTFRVEQNGTDQLIETLWEKLRPAINVDNLYKMQFKVLAEQVCKDHSSVVVPQYENVFDNFFSQLTNEDISITSLAWVFQYYQTAFSDPDSWDVMLAISEEGRFLRQDIDRGVFNKKSFGLILATTGIDRPKTELEKKLETLNLVSGAIRYRPWWMHNKHMAIFLKRMPTPYTGDWKQDWTLVEGYFYRHHMLSRRITPVKISHRYDLERLLIMFAIYWYGACDKHTLEYPENTRMGIVKDEKQSKEIIRNLLKACDDSIGAK